MPENLGRAVLQLSTQDRGLTSGIQRARSAATGLNQRFGALRTTLRGLGPMLGGLGAAGLGATLVSGANDAAVAFDDLQATMNRLVGLVGISREQTEEWRGELIAMAPAVRQGPEALANALFFITSSGQRGSQAMETLRQTALGASSGLGDINDIARLVTSTMAVYSEEGLSASEIMDILTATIREGVFESRELAEAMPTVTSAAQLLGISFNELGGLLASLSRVETDAATATRGLRQVFLKLAAPTQRGRELIEQYFGSVDNLKDMLRTDLMGALNALDEAFGDNEEALKAVFEDVNAFTVFLQLMRNDGQDTAQILSDLADNVGDFGAAIEAAAEGGKAASEELAAAWQSMMVTIGGGVSTPKENLQRWISGVLERTTRFVQTENKFAQFTQDFHEGLINMMEGVTGLDLSGLRFDWGGAPRLASEQFWAELDEEMQQQAQIATLGVTGQLSRISGNRPVMRGDATVSQSLPQFQRAGDTTINLNVAGSIWAEHDLKNTIRDVLREEGR